MEKKKIIKQEAIDLLKNRKVYVNGKSKEIQEKLFKLGFKWYNNVREIQYENSPFIFIHDNMAITEGMNMKSFMSHNYTEISYEEIITMDIVDEFKENDVVVSGWDTLDGRKCKWIAIVDTFTTDFAYTAKVLLYTVKDSSDYPDIMYNVFPNSQDWTRPATEEEKQKLIDTLMKSSSETRAKRILKEVFDIEKYTFKPFDKVLVRDNNNAVWRPALFWKIQDNIDYPYLTIINGDYAQCIPYEGNEKLIDTSNKPE